MPTKFYLHNAAAPYTPATIRGAWDQTAGAVTKALDTQREGGGANAIIQIAETSATNPFRVLVYRGVTGPLAAQTLSGTVDVVIGVSESAAAADINWYLHFYVTQGNSDTPRGTILADFSEGLGVNEWPTTTTFKGLNAAAALAALAINAGDRIVCEIGYVSREASATSRTGALRYGPLNAATLAVQADGAAAGTDVTLKSGFITFSGTITEDAVAVRLSHAAGQVVSAATATAPVRLSQMVLQVLSRNAPAASDPSGGGETDTGTEPPADSSLCGETTALAWFTIQTAAGEKKFSAQGINVGLIVAPAKVKSWGGAIVRALSDGVGRPETMAATIVLADEDGEMADAAYQGLLLNRRVDYFVASYAQLAAGGAGRHIGMALVRNYRSVNFEFSIDVEDSFGAILGELGDPKTTPQLPFSPDDFQYLPQPLFGKYVPYGYGLQSDESKGSNAIGVVPGFRVGTTRLSDGQDWGTYVLCHGAPGEIQSAFGSNGDPDNPRPIKIDPAAEGVTILLPRHAGWNAIVGADPFVDINGRRFGIIYAIGVIDDDAASGDVPISVNMAMQEDVGDGSGTYIDSAPRQVMHLINNRLIQNYVGGDWLSLLAVNGYSLINTPSFEVVRTASITRIGGAGYIGHIYVGLDGAQQTDLELIRQVCQDFDFDLGVDRHGRIMASMVDASAASVKSFSDISEIYAGTFGGNREFLLLKNRIVYRYQRNYIIDARSDSARTGFEWWSDFLGVVPLEDTVAQTAAQGEKRDRVLEMFSVRDQATADSVAAQLLARNAYGPFIASFDTDGCGLDVELGDNIRVTAKVGPKDGAGTDPKGWTNQLMRVTRIEVDFDKLQEGQGFVNLSGLWLDDPFY